MSKTIFTTQLLLLSVLVGGCLPSETLEATRTHERKSQLSEDPLLIPDGANEVPTFEGTPVSFLGRNSQFSTVQIPAQGSRFEVVFTSIPSDDVTHGLIGLSSGVATQLPHLETSVRFAQDESIDVMSQDAYVKGRNIRYKRGELYRFRLIVDPKVKEYTVYVKVGGNSEELVIERAQFRQTQQEIEKIDHISAWGSDGTSVQAQLISLKETTEPLATQDEEDENPEPTPRPTSTPAPKVTFQTIRYTGVETDNYGVEYSTGQSAKLPHSIQRSQNGNIYRFEVRSGERKESDTTKGAKVERSELQDTRTVPFGTEIWGAYSFKMEKGQVPKSSWIVMGQMHSGNGTPPFEVTASKERLGIVMKSGTQSSSRVTTHIYDAPLVRDRWYNVIFRLVFGIKKDAIVQVWIDGERVVNLSGVNMGYTNDTGRTYWKFGLYRQEDSTTQSIQYANMEISPTQNLSRRITDPKPIIP